MKKLLNNQFFFDTITKRIKRKRDGPIAQLAEHSTENAGVRSSTLRWATTMPINERRLGFLPIG